jgi:membrane protease YdiL (CAAX protease family)
LKARRSNPFHRKEFGLKQTLDLRRITIFLAFAFGIAWAIALIIFLTGQIANSPTLFVIGGVPFSLALVLLALGYMTAPALAHVLTRIITREGWKDTHLAPKFHNWRYWLAAWVVPAAIIGLGVLVYFLVYPQQFDSQLSAVQLMLDNVAAQTGEVLPVGVWALVLIQVVQAILIAPIFNGLFTLGEEFGWRAYLQPKLMPLGFRPAMLWMGLIWGVWHWPAIVMGHNYGLDYWGAPWSGLLLTIWVMTCIGTILGWWTQRAGSVWPAVIGHAAFNGFAAIGTLFVLPGSQPNPLLGPLPVGLIGGLPLTLLTVYLLWKGKPAYVSRETKKDK